MWNQQCINFSFAEFLYTISFTEILAKAYQEHDIKNGFYPLPFNKRHTLKNYAKHAHIYHNIISDV